MLYATMCAGGPVLVVRRDLCDNHPILSEVNGYAVDVGAPFLSLMGTDLWCRIEDSDVHVFQSDELLFKCPIEAGHEEYFSQARGLLWIRSEIEFTDEQKQALGQCEALEEMQAWMRQVEQESGKSEGAINGTLVGIWDESPL